MYTYPWYHWILFFFFYSFCGWVFESTYVSIRTRRFVNRGFLRLPLLPLYGTGAVMMLWLSLPVKDSVVLVYLSGVVGATVLEYVTGWVMEKLFKMKYWDYSDQKFNLNGYICLSSSVTWGFLTIFLTEIVHQPVAGLVLRMDHRVEFALIAVVGAAFLADTVVSVKEALDLGRALEAMTKMKAELDDLQVQAALLRSEIEARLESLSAAEVRAEAASRLSGIKEDAAAKVSGAVTRAAGAAAHVAEAGAGAVARVAEAGAGVAARVTGAGAGAAARMAEAGAGAVAHVAGAGAGAAARVAEAGAGAAARMAGAREEAAAFLREHRRKEEALAARIRALDEKRQALAGHMDFYRRDILRGNPTASSARFAGALKELREKADKRADTREE